MTRLVRDPSGWKGPSTLRIPALVLAAWLCLVSPAAAQTLSVELTAPEGIAVGDRAELIARVQNSGGLPILITPHSEGTAIEVVRGRLMRADAREPSAQVLEFHIPVVARQAGTAVIRVRAAGYACPGRCRSVQAETSMVVRVAGRTAPSAEKKQVARSSSLSWVRLEGAERCVASAALAQAVERRLDRDVFVSAADASLAVEGRIERRQGGWRAVIHIVDADGASLGERTLESHEPTCDQLGELAAVTIALMIDPLTAPPTPSEETPGPDRDPPVEPPPEPHNPEPPNPEPENPEPDPPHLPSPAPPAPEDPSWMVDIQVGLGGSLGLLPTPMIGGLSTVIVHPPGFIPILIEAALFPFSRAEASSGHADLLHAHAGVQLCPLWFREGRFAAQGCLGVDAGAVLVIGGDLNVESSERVIGQAQAVIRGDYRIVGPLTLHASVHLIVPFRHDAFAASIGGVRTEFYQPEPIAGMVDLGIGIHIE